MKAIFLFFIFAVIPSAVLSQNNWTTIDYNYSSGPVSPEYQYNYQIVINSNGTGNIIYTKGTEKTDNSFRISRNGLNRLNAAIRNSQVITVDPNDMKSNENLMGGKSRTLKVTMSQPVNTDQPPRVINIPSQLNSTYSAGVLDLYYVIEMLVPPSVWHRTVN
jgi:hypothetical protein